MNFDTKIAALVVAGLMTSLGLIVGLNTLKFDTTMHELADDRAEIVLGEVAQTLQTAIDLGLSLESGKEIRKDAQTKDAAILDLALFGPEGRFVDSASVEALGAPIPPAWLAMHQRSAGERWSIVDDRQLVTGIPLETRLGVKAGGAVLVLSLGDTHSRVAAAAGDMASAAAVIFAVMVAIALPACFLLSRRLQRFLAALERRFSTDADRLDSPDLPVGLAGLTDAFSDNARQIDEAISNIEANAGRGAS